MVTARIIETTRGLSKADYKGKPTTLCPGCGHNTIFQRIIEVAYEQALDPAYVIKMSGIGCSSKSAAYFMERSHGFNGLHGRMPSAVSGAVLANHKLTAIGLSGDGDSGSIGLGQFKHLVRRNVPMVYIIENNGVYGLTKGQFSATADKEQFSKYAGGTNNLQPVDLCIEALAADATFVARSFAGKPQQVTELLKAALHHRGTAVLDIISPCVAFGETPMSTKTYEYGRENFEQFRLHDISFIPARDSFIPEREEIILSENGEEDCEDGCDEVMMHDGTWIRLRELHEDYDPFDKYAAIHTLMQARDRQEFITGLIYVDEDSQNFYEQHNMVETPLAHLNAAQMRPSREALEQVMASL
ncbi:MAG: 2-oxoacid:ferredoxin oxidoreductase subunit beta [Anaerolineae bacterium]|nr:2-oxoacid:ferredoxin oxidoreductase subunit beta [Anaerolineae bacterium]